MNFVGDQVLKLSSASGEVNELKFVFMLYYNYVSTLLCGITLYHHDIFQFILMLLTKLFCKWLQFDHNVITLKKKLKSCCCTVNVDDIEETEQNLYATEFIYSIISDFTMYPSIIFMILVDYFQNNVWFVNGTKTNENLRFAILTIIIILIFDVFVIIMIYCCNNKHEYYKHEKLNCVSIPVYYFFLCFNVLSNNINQCCQKLVYIQ